MIIQGMHIDAVPTGVTEVGDAMGTMEEVVIFISGNGVATSYPEKLWRPKGKQ